MIIFDPTKDAIEDFASNNDINKHIVLNMLVAHFMELAQGGVYDYMLWNKSNQNISLTKIWIEVILQKYRIYLGSPSCSTVTLERVIEFRT